MFDEFSGIGFMIGYEFFDYTYNPNAICLNEFYDYTEAEKKGRFQLFTFGFSFYYDLAKKIEDIE